VSCRQQSSACAQTRLRTVRMQDAHNLLGEATHGLFWCSFHEQEDAVVLHQLHMWKRAWRGIRQLCATRHIPQALHTFSMVVCTSDSSLTSTLTFGLKSSWVSSDIWRTV